MARIREVAFTTPRWWRAVLFGGAIGDALGAPIELDTHTEIRRRFGPAGLTELIEHDGRLGAITDDTQMTLFTAEAYLAFRRRSASYGIAAFAPACYYSYQRWMATQGEQPTPLSYREVELRGLLFDSSALRHRRGPGKTCLSALRSGKLGSRTTPINNSKGCGGVMRVAPLAEWGTIDLGATAAAVTHGHPTGQLAAGALVMLLRTLANNAPLAEAIAMTIQELTTFDGHDETALALHHATQLAASRQAGATAIAELGTGWVAEEALAIAVFAALRAEADYVAGVVLAANHDGDSDSTAAIAGQLIAARFPDSLPACWIDLIETKAELETIAADLATGLAPLEDGHDDAFFTAHATKYPYQ